MSQFIVEGKSKLSGIIAVNGNKNEALPAVAASLLCPDTVTLHNIPEIGDTQTMLKIAEQLGTKVSPITDNTVTLKTNTVKQSELPLELSQAIRGSILFASVVLVWTGKIVISQPGGDTNGRRRIDTHLLAFLLTPEPIPEPATIALIGIGLAGLVGGAARRKWKKKAVDKS